MAPARYSVNSNRASWPLRALLGELKEQVLVLRRVDGQRVLRVAGNEVEALAAQVLLDLGQALGLEHGAADALAVTAQVVRDRPVAGRLEQLPDSGADLQLHALGARPQPRDRADLRDIGQ